MHLIQQGTNKSPHTAYKINGPFLQNTTKKSSLYINLNQLNVQVQSSLQMSQFSKFIMIATIATITIIMQLIFWKSGGLFGSPGFGFYFCLIRADLVQ